MAKHFTFEIDAPGESAAGIQPCTDEIIVTVESGDPGGDPDGAEFAQFITDVLKEWYDTTRVELVLVETDNRIVYEKQQWWPDYKDFLDDHWFLYEQDK